jgi:undecaprenyl diphosphate synthase
MQGLLPPPRHVAIIMDGNGRWASRRSLPRAAGHREGVEALRRTVDAAGAIGLEALTVFSFSTENWRRPRAEIDALFELLRHFVRSDLARLHAAGVRIRVIGERAGVAEDIVSLIREAEALTAGNSALKLNIAFNYGGRAELVAAARILAEAVAAGQLAPAEISEERFRAALWSADSPDPDLLIRTSGEHRISNFLLWGLAYCELIFMDVLWPDFDRHQLEAAIDSYRRRDRRYGGLGV